MDDVRKAAINFEAVKVSMSQTKDGIILRLALHPNECPPSLHTDWVGSRYMVAMVKLGDDDAPQIPDQNREIDKMISQAGLLCRNPDLAQYMQTIGIVLYDASGNPTLDPEEKSVIEGLREHLGIKSRSELRNNSQARELFKELVDGFTRYKKGYQQ